MIDDAIEGPIPGICSKAVLSAVLMSILRIDAPVEAETVGTSDWKSV